METKQINKTETALTVGQKYYQANGARQRAVSQLYYILNKAQQNKGTNDYYKTHGRISFLGKSVNSTLPKVKKGHVYHHMCYNHENADDFTFEMKLSDHLMLHMLMRKLEVKVPHINEHIQWRSKV